MWDVFRSAIHEQTLPAVSKFSYLRSVLKGSALSAIAGIPLTSENYSLVIKLLQERFGRKEAIVESLYSKLQNLPKSGNKFAEVQQVCETIEKLLRQLEAQGESINEQRTLIQQIISKYPTEVIIKLEESKELATPWTMKSLFVTMLQYKKMYNVMFPVVTLLQEGNLLCQDNLDLQPVLTDLLQRCWLQTHREVVVEVAKLKHHYHVSFVKVTILMIHVISVLL